MCIVSIFSQKNGDFILTHNRDESHLRPTSEAVSTQEIFHKKYTGPKDLVSGGTWIYYSKSFVCCILNGEYQKHSHQPPYRKSRGLVLLDVLKYASFDAFSQQENFEGIEPFTLIFLHRLTTEKKILVWDGANKHIEDVSEQEIIVRSSSPLYNAAEKMEHQMQFEHLKNNNAEEIYQLHDQLKMLPNDRFPTVQTTSITQIIHQKNAIDLLFCPIS
ncbi:MAG TPA: NRDE family protein [Moheibacter sp.]|nr:NRDE family protein [Moheibacter sp.]